MAIHWAFQAFDSLTTRELYTLLRLRSEVFIIGQQCVYQDLDGKDQQAIHLTGTLADEMVCYCRLFPPGMCYEPAGIGRVLTAPAWRKKGLARRMMEEAIAFIASQWPASAIQLSAQLYLREFYGSLGFLPFGSVYEEEHIPHLKMIRKQDSVQTPDK